MEHRYAESAAPYALSVCIRKAEEMFRLAIRDSEAKN